MSAARGGRILLTPVGPFPQVAKPKHAVPLPNPIALPLKDQSWETVQSARVSSRSGAMNQRERSRDGTIAIGALRSALKNQRHAALAMLRAAIRRSPDDVWAKRGRMPIHSGG